MLNFKLSRIFALRGIDKPFAYLVKLGFSRATASNLLNDRVLNVKVWHMNTICRALNCTPNDLFEWTPADERPLPENHPLNALKREKNPARLSQIVNDIPVDKLHLVEELLNQLKN
jgi:DNA-binding Xre family transcriptional regulator